MTELFITSRGGGKTTKIIEMLQQDPRAIVVVIHEEERMRFLKMGIPKEQVIRFEEVLHGGLKGLNNKTILVDNLDMMLNRIFGQPVKAVTWSASD